MAVCSSHQPRAALLDPPTRAPAAGDQCLLVHRDARCKRLPPSSKTDEQSPRVRDETDRAKHYPDDGVDDSDDLQDRAAKCGNTFRACPSPRVRPYPVADDDSRPPRARTLVASALCWRTSPKKR